ncbi:hypothetical protein MTP99_017044 [Tenebrio molitor]|nr:hypothetical protein MTP99_017044 [Tenebrio molitor]
MGERVRPLCCCEYFDNNDERSHILACCCNCVDLDEGFESLITGQGFPERNRSQLMATIHDRLRIPWRGGAKQVAFDAILPVNSSLGKIGENEAESGFVGTSNRCFICQVLVPDKDHHCVWFDCCIGRHNQCLFILTLFFAIASLLYSSNLTLTSVCHPFIFYKTILLPDDCSDVYQQFELGLSFVAALYSLGLAVMLLLLFLHQILLVSLGMTSKEWRNLSFCAKCFLGLCSKRPHNYGFVKNWSRIMCWNRNYNIALCCQIHNVKQY